MTHDSDASITSAQQQPLGSALGRWADPAGERIVAWHPDAVQARFMPDGPALEVAGGGRFVWTGPADQLPVPYYIEWRFPDGKFETTVDFAQFAPDTDAEERAAFHAGRHTSAWRLLGAHARQRARIEGVRFTVWAPHADRVSVVGNFNGWDGRRHPMTRHEGGIWEVFLPGVGAGDLYKFALADSAGNVWLKADPYARAAQPRPETASVIVSEEAFTWSDQAWLDRRPGWQNAPVAFYEVHLGSWLRHPDGRFYGYREIAERLAAYVADLGFTHVELMPITEHPLDASWGYQCTGWFAPTRRYGDPDDFRAFVDTLHRYGIGVVLDWVPGHFPRDAHGLARFDGTPLYEHGDPRRADMADWGTLAFDHGRSEVRSFLVSSAMYWLREFHIDGIRVDAVASMLYLDYGREQSESVRNEHGGRENLEAVAFLQQLNETTHSECPDTFTVAEESTAWPGVSRPTYVGGLGFSMKWNMGWMHDSLTYLQHDPVHRHYHHENLTFALVYAFTENFVLPLSHDEVVHLKGSLLGRMPGDEWQRFANLRLLFLWQFTHPGKKLLFMGGEIGNPQEWDENLEPAWDLADRPLHGGVRHLVKDLAHAYHRHTALHALDFSDEGFRWIDFHDATQSIIAYRRMDDRGNEAVVALNFTPVPRHGYAIGLPHGGHWRELLNTDSEFYGGSGQGNYGGVTARAQPWMNLSHSAEITLPPLGGIVLVPGERQGG